VCTTERTVLAGRPAEIAAWMARVNTKASFRARKLAAHPDLVALEITRLRDCPAPPGP
jgi:hypothetical protein